MDLAFVFALLSGVSAATYSIFQRLGAPGMNPALGAMVVAAIAFAVNLVVLLVILGQGHAVAFSRRGLGFLVVVGVAAAGVDLFGLLAYARGFQVTASPLVTATYLALLLLVGFVVFREPFTWTKLLAIGLIATGILLLHQQGVSG